VKLHEIYNIYPELQNINEELVIFVLPIVILMYGIRGINKLPNRALYRAIFFAVAVSVILY